MSWEAVEWVLRHSPTTGTDRLVMIVLANASNDHTPDPWHDAWTAWPGLDRIAREAGVSHKRTAQGAIERLCDAGAITREVNGGGDENTRRDRRPNLYLLALSNGVYPCRTPRCDFCANGVYSAASTGCTPVHDGVYSDARTGCAGSTPEQSFQQSTERSSLNAGFADFELMAEPPEPTPLPNFARRLVEEYAHLGRGYIHNHMQLAGFGEEQIAEALAQWYRPKTDLQVVSA